MFGLLEFLLLLILVCIIFTVATYMVLERAMNGKAEQVAIGINLKTVPKSSDLSVI